jgi:hypothetical protein
VAEPEGFRRASGRKAAPFPLRLQDSPAPPLRRALVSSCLAENARLKSLRTSIRSPAMRQPASCAER